MELPGCRHERWAESSPVACLVCRVKGRQVALHTVKVVLTEQALRRLESDVYFFCVNPDCATVYFSGSGIVFDRADLRVPVWQKESPGARTICYCFGENEAIIREELQQSGSSGAAERIRAHIAADRCACEWRNPRGECCLGDVLAAIKRESIGHAGR